MAEECKARPADAEVVACGKQVSGASCVLCGAVLRSTRERTAQTCSYHLDVLKGPPRWSAHGVVKP